MEKSDREVKLNWQFNDIHFWSNKYNLPDEYVMYK